MLLCDTHCVAVLFCLEIVLLMLHVPKLIFGYLYYLKKTELELLPGDTGPAFPKCNHIREQLTLSKRWVNFFLPEKAEKQQKHANLKW